MVERSRIGLLFGALAAVLLPGLAGCTETPYAGPPPGYPPWYYDYYYYPHVDVYFHIYSGDYWYPDGPYWHRARRLPPHFHLDPAYRVRLRVPDERPYRDHDAHRRAYPRPAAGRVPEPRPQPQAGAQPGLPLQPGDWRTRDSKERADNIRRYEEYRKKPWVAP
jgi:hypothetical protein